MHTNFAGLAQRLCRLGCTCVALNERPLAKALAQARLLVIPPPTGWYNARKECWVPHAPALFMPEEIQALLSFLRDGGRLLAFAYRFGDSFTGTNLRDLFGPLGCLLHDDAVIDITALRATPSLQTHFDTPADLLPLPWFRRGVDQLRWRASATFTLVPGATAQPLALSPGGRCISFDRTQRRISFVSRPVAVAGTLAKGRFVLCGGPHPFETGTYGLLNEADNRQFIDHILRWLLKKDVFPLEASPETPAPARPWLVPGLVGDSEAFTFVEGHGSGEETVASVERVLRKGELNRFGNLMVLSSSVNRQIKNYDYKMNKLPAYASQKEFEIVRRHARLYPEWNLAKCKERKEQEVNKLVGYLCGPQQDITKQT